MQRRFETMEQLNEALPSIWQEPFILEAIKAANDRFEDRLRHAVTVRHEVRTGERISQEEITVSIYEWIRRFLARTHRLEILEVTIGGVPYELVLDLFEHTHVLREKQ